MTSLTAFAFTTRRRALSSAWLAGASLCGTGIDMRICGVDDLIL